MKRLPIFVFATALMLGLAACGSPPPSAELEGQWVGQTEGDGATVPMSFEVGPNGQVANGTFNASYESEHFSFAVDSSAMGNTLTVTAIASNSAGDSLRFELTGQVDGDTMTGTYRLEIRVGSTTTTQSGTFTLTKAGTV